MRTWVLVACQASSITRRGMGVGLGWVIRENLIGLHAGIVKVGEAGGPHREANGSIVLHQHIWRSAVAAWAAALCM